MKSKTLVILLFILISAATVSAYPSHKTTYGYASGGEELKTDVDYEDLQSEWNSSKTYDMTDKWSGDLDWGGTHNVFSIKLNTKELIEQGKMREDCADIRLAWNKELVPSRVQAGDCGAENTWVYFSNARVDEEMLFDPSEKVKKITVFYGNKNPGRKHESVSPYNDNQATFVHPEGAIEMYYGTHQSTTYVNHDTHLHDEGVSGGEGYQTWHVDFQSSQYGDQAPDFISISDDDGNRATVNSPGDTYTVYGSDYSWIDEGEPISVYFETWNVESSTVTNNWPVTNRVPNQPSNPDPAESTSTSPVYNTHPELSFQVSDPDNEPVDIDIYNGFTGTWNFNTCGASGNTGPSQNQCDNSYSGTSLDGEVNVVSPGIQEWTVPRDGQYRIRTAGASGSYGHGAVVQGTFTLSAGTTLQILVGQTPSSDGGAGGTFVARGSSHTSASPLVVAGGGAGGDQGDSSASDGWTNSYGQDSPTGPNGGNNGYGGNGGDGGGGGGFYSNGGTGSDGEGGQAFQNGGEGGSNSASTGGFGGGGTAEDAGGDEAGGAGGYSGGGAAEDGGCECAGGGGSFIDSSASSAATHTGSFSDSSSNDNGYSGTVSDLGGANTGDGYVTIEAEGSLLESQNDVSDGSTVSWEWSNRNIGQSYDWYVRACDDDNSCSYSPVWTFTVEQGPLEPIDPEPADGAVVNSNTVNLNARYRHQGGYDGTLRFYNADNGNELYSCSVSDGNKCSTPYSWNVNSGQTYNWYAVAESNGASKQSATWSFTANTPPDQPSNPSPTDGATSVDYNSGNLEVYVSDPDGHTMDVTFSAQGQSTGDTLSKTTTVSGSGTASVSYSSLEPGETYEWTVTAEDEHGASTTSSTWSFTTNHLPTVQNPDPSDGEYISSDEVEVSIAVSDDDGDQTDIRIYDEDGNMIGSGQTGDGSQKTISADYTGLSYGNTYDWTVEASDSYGTKSRTFSFSVIGGSSFRPVTGINYRYSSIIKSSTQAKFVEYEVTNMNSNEKDLQTSLTGLDAQFQQYGTDSHTYTLQPGETKTFRIEVFEKTTGDYTLEVVTQDRQLGVQNKDSIPVVVREFSASAVERAPGLMWIQLLFLAAGATFLYSALL